jgi:hypothetical protein
MGKKRKQNSFRIREIREIRGQSPSQFVGGVGSAWLLRVETTRGPREPVRFRVIISSTAPPKKVANSKKFAANACSFAPGRW